jgi:hypothetical protein
VWPFLNCQCGTNFFFQVAVETKSVTPTFDRLVSGGYAFGDLMIIVDFWFDGGMIVDVLGPSFNWGPRGLFLFLARFPAGVTGAESGLDR